jgi:hypothetical protein
MSAHRLAPLSILLLFALAAQGAPKDTAAQSSAPVPPATSFAPVLQALKKADGQIVPAVRDAYVNWAEQSVLQQLNDANETLSVKGLAEINADLTLRDALFATAYPPDPNILRQYAYLRNTLGPDFVKKYHSLVIGVAVATRARPVKPTGAAAADADNSDDADDADLSPDDGVSDEVADAESLPPQSSELVDAIANFLTAEKITALQLYQSPDEQQRLVTALQSQKFPPRQVAQVKQPLRLFHLIKGAMVQLGQRPAYREVEPDTVTWLRYLATNFEATPSSTPTVKGLPKSWPLFPLTQAPWPLLMPMARPLPLGEARYIWEKFQGEHGADRYHLYGPYRGLAGAIPYELQPSPWSWSAWPDRIIHGGVCVVMSGIATDTHSALGEPSLRAAQPHHSNLISYKGTNYQWYTVIEQAFAGGPNVTHAQWPFDEPVDPALHLIRNHSAGAEYQLGLTQAMNLSLSSYMDTRIAVNLYRALNPTQQKTLGQALLTSAIQRNPYNPEPWYLLAHQTINATQGLALVQIMPKPAPNPSNGDEPAAKSTQATLENWEEPDETKPVEKTQRQYWNTLEEFVTRSAILRHPVPADEAAARQVYNFLKAGVPGITPDDYAAYAKRFSDIPDAPLPGGKGKHKGG